VTSKIVIYGATGHTGRLVARRLAAQTDRVHLAGRNRARLKALSETLGGVPFHQASTSDPQALSALLHEGDVLVSTVGPYNTLGFSAVDAARARGAHYLDAAGEAGHLRRLLTQEVDSPVLLLPGFAFESVLGNVAAARALDMAGSTARSVKVLYLCDPTIASRGTRLSAAGSLLEDGYGLRNGELVRMGVGRSASAFRIDGRTVRGVSIATSEPLVLQRTYPELENVRTFMSGLGPVPLLVTAAAAMSGLRRIPGVQGRLTRMHARVVDRVMRNAAPAPGPSTTRRSGAAAEVRDGAGRVLSRALFDGGDPYLVTAELLSWAALEAAAGRVTRHGALGPVQAFALADLEAVLSRCGFHSRSPEVLGAAVATRSSPTLSHPTAEGPSEGVA
jgi:short subunit dehydrogenase-like uncharacterized protein